MWNKHAILVLCPYFQMHSVHLAGDTHFKDCFLLLFLLLLSILFILLNDQKICVLTKYLVIDEIRCQNVANTCHSLIPLSSVATIVGLFAKWSLNNLSLESFVSHSVKIKHGFHHSNHN